MSDKYVVIKADAWPGHRQTDDGLRVSGIIPDEGVVHDAVVIRRSDIFAPTVLWTYANNVVSVMELIEEYFDSEEEEYSTILDNLQNVHEYFAHEAELSSASVNKRFPTP